MKKKSVKIIVCLMIGLLSLSSINSYATEFEGKEAEYTKLCANKDKTEEEKAICKQYSAYLLQKKKDIQAEIEKTANDIDAIKGNMEKLTEQYNSYSVQVRNLEANIIAIDEAAIIIGNNIVTLQNEIDIKLADIEARDKEIKDRMFNMQPSASTNLYIDFVMGATDFIDFMRRTDGVKSITEYDQDLIQKLAADKKKLENDKQELENQKTTLDEQKIQRAADIEYVNQLKAQNEQLLEAYQAQESVLLEQKRGNEAKRKEIQATMTKVDPNAMVSSNSNWAYPIQDNFYFSANTWYYGDGATPHLGLDFAPYASVGTALYAPIDAIILYANNPCPTYGGLGQWVGFPAGGGNTVHMLGIVNGTTYAVSYFHMQRENFAAVGGSTVVQGQWLGNVGSSGNSSGPHLHMEVINLGDMSLSEAIERFNNTADFAWGTGWNLNRTCDSTGGGTPCRARPENIYGV